MYNDRFIRLQNNHYLCEDFTQAAHREFCLQKELDHLVLHPSYNGTHVDFLYPITI